MSDGMNRMSFCELCRGFAGLMIKLFTIFLLLTIIPLTMFVEGCRTLSVRPNPELTSQLVIMEVTGYDSGPRSCGWERDWMGRPVYSSGPNKGKPKAIGITASGSRAKHGTIAADTKYYPFGTVMYIPGYGYGVVEDRGGDIKGRNRLDLWFPTEDQAFKWGRKKNVRVQVWLPENKKNK